MGENEWLNGYLEAILEVGRKAHGTSSSTSASHDHQSQILISRTLLNNNTLEDDQDDEFHERKLFSPTNYFIEQVVNGFDEADLHKTWIQVIATRNSRQRNNSRLENMCWRIWHLARRKKQIAWDATQKLVKRRIGRQREHHDAAEDLSELSDGEKEKPDSSSVTDIISTIHSHTQILSDDKSRQLYIVLIRYIITLVHKFSWPEHCRNYLSHVELCRKYHPTNHLSVMPIPEEPLSDSLRGVEDLSLKFSIDLDVIVNGELDVSSSQHKVIDILLQRATSNERSTNIYCPERRQWLYIIAVDCYNIKGSPTEALPLIIKNVMQVAGSKSSEIGFVLLTGMNLLETKDLLSNCRFKLEQFDALVCSCGSEMYYPWRDLVVDEDYESNIEYRWPGENVNSMVMRFASSENRVESDMQLYQCSSRYYSYNIKSGAKKIDELRQRLSYNFDNQKIDELRQRLSYNFDNQKIDELRQSLRMRGLRFNLVYTHAASRLSVIPLFASRAQALRYLSVRWGMDHSKVILFMGGSGDSDYIDLLGGLFRTIVLGDSANYADSELNGHNEDGLKKDDMVAQESTQMAFADGLEVHDISKVLGCLGLV